MATVRITKRLLEAVEDKLRHLYNTEQNERYKRKPDAAELLKGTVTPQFILEAAWKEHLGVMLAVPYEWCKYPDRIMINSCRGDASYTINNRFSDVQIPFPPTASSYSEYIVLRDETHPWNVAMAAWDAEGKEITLRHSALRDNVLDALKSYPTLNRALGANPALVHVVPEEFLENVRRMEEKKPREKKEAVEPVKIDAGALTAAVALTSLVE